MNGITSLLKLIFIFFLFISGQLAQTENKPNGPILPSLEWQKLSLEEKITTKIKKSLDAIITSGQYIVDVELIVTEATKPDFTQTPPPPPKNVRFSNAQPGSAPKDYIVFSQLGLEAPLISEFEEVAKKKSEYEYLWKYNENMDIFKNIEELNIKLSLSDLLLDETKTSVTNIVESLKFGIPDIEPKIDIEYIDLEERVRGKDEVAGEVKPLSLREKLDYMSRLSNAIGLILAVVLLGMIAYFLFKMWEKIRDGQDSQAPAMAPITQAQDDKEDEDKDKEIAPSFGDGLPEEAGDMFNAIERFKQFWEKSKQDALILVKKWIVENEGMSRKALSALVQQLENKELVQMFQAVSPLERDMWRRIIEEEGKIGDLSDVNNFISRQIIEDMIVPPAVQDLETVDLLMMLDEQAAAEMIRSNPEEGAMLMNIMHTKYVSKILEFLHPDEMKQVMDYSFAINKEIIQQNIPQFKKVLKNFAAKKEDKEFIGKVLQLIPTAAPDTEHVLYRSLAVQCERETLEKFARKYYPAEIIKDRFEEDLKENILKTYPMAKKTELIASIVDEDERADFLDSFAPDGSTAREMIEFELEKFEDDPILQKQVIENKDNIWKEYITHCRKMIKSDAAFKQDADELLEIWLNEVQATDETYLQEAA